MTFKNACDKKCLRGKRNTLKVIICLIFQQRKQSSGLWYQIWNTPRENLTATAGAQFFVHVPSNNMGKQHKLWLEFKQFVGSKLMNCVIMPLKSFVFWRTCFIMILGFWNAMWNKERLVILSVEALSEPAFIFEFRGVCGGRVAKQRC